MNNTNINFVRIILTFLYLNDQYCCNNFDMVNEKINTNYIQLVQMYR